MDALIHSLAELFVVALLIGGIGLMMWLFFLGFKFGQWLLREIKELKL